ncbi:MAG: penicillin-binding protein activator [Betaproteobacteria bacterium]|nr:MAG: penicillin-binding protein activator [Betaproteobacteria bacterium]
MPAGLRAQFCFASLALLSPALCAAVDDPASRPADERPFIGLLLPLNAPDFARAAEAVRLGCQAALVFAENRPALRVLRTDARPESILAEYQIAVQSGAGVIVGPLTRSGVSALAAEGRVSVATLALNVADGDAPLPPRLYTFGLSVDAEARIVARMAFARGLREAVVVQASNLLAKRLGRAFADEWFALGGRISDIRELGSRAELGELRRGLADSQAQFTFLAAEADQARTVRPYLNNQMPVFATSQVNDGKTGPLVNSDLNGMRFVDMPWLVQPDHAAVMIYPRLEGFSTELQRFYALGIDSCRIASGLLSGQQRVSLDGVTGKISYHGGNALERQPVQAVFRDGVGVSAEDSR